MTIEKAKPREKGYVCPGCQNEVIVRKGKKRKPHFAHKAGATCITGYQTSLHLLAKGIILQEKRFRIPDLTEKFAVDGCYTVLVSNNKVLLSFPLAKTLDLSEATIKSEQRLFDRIPDILIEYQKQQLIVEIYVTHKVPEDKIADIKKIGISAIEIDLSKQDMPSEDEQTRQLCGGIRPAGGVDGQAYSPIQVKTGRN